MSYYTLTGLLSPLLLTVFMSGGWYCGLLWGWLSFYSKYAISSHWNSDIFIHLFTIWIVHLFQLNYAHQSAFFFLFSSYLRFKGLPPEDATWVCGCGFCQPARQQHSHGGWVITDPTPGGWRRVGAGTMHVVLKHEKVRNTDKTAALARLATSDFDQRGSSLWSSMCVWSSHVCLSHADTHISSAIFPHPLSSILVYQSPSLSLSVSVELPVSTGSLSCTRSQPSLFFRSRIIWPPRGKLVYFWAGLTIYEPYCDSISSAL